MPQKKRLFKPVPTYKSMFGNKYLEQTQQLQNIPDLVSGDIEIPDLVSEDFFPEKSKDEQFLDSFFGAPIGSEADVQPQREDDTQQPDIGLEEVALRRPELYPAYQKGRSQGLSHDAAVRIAEFELEKTKTKDTDNGKDKPGFFKGILGTIGKQGFPGQQSAEQLQNLPENIIGPLRTGIRRTIEEAVTSPVSLAQTMGSMLIAGSPLSPNYEKNKKTASGFYEWVEPIRKNLDSFVAGQLDKALPIYKKTGKYEKPTKSFKEFFTDPQRMWNVVAENATLMGFFVANTLINPVLGMAAMAAVEGHDSQKTIDEYEKRTGEQLPENVKWAIPASVGAINAALEYAGIKQILKVAKVPGLEKKVVQGLIAMITEGSQEGLQEVTQILGEMGYDKEVKDINWDRVAESAYGGIMLALVGGAASGFAGEIDEKIVKEALDQTEQPTEEFVKSFQEKSKEFADKLPEDVVTEKPAEPTKPKEEIKTEAKPEAKQEIKPEPKKGVIDVESSVIKAEDLWNKTPVEIDDTFNNVQDDITKIEEKLKPEIKQLKEERSKLKGRTKEAIKRRKEIQNKIDELESQFKEANEKFNEMNVNESVRFNEQLREKISKDLGITDEDKLTDIAVDIGVALNERTGMPEEQTNKPLSEIYNDEIAKLKPEEVSKDALQEERNKEKEYAETQKEINPYLTMPIDRVRVDADNGIKLAKEALVERKDEIQESKPKKTLVKKGQKENIDDKITTSENVPKKHKELWEMTRGEIKTKYSKANKIVDGRKIRDDIPNISSISSSVDNPTILDGIYEIPLSEFDLSGKHYSVEGTKRINDLADKIKESGEINPLIVVIDSEKQPYILEGATRAEALYKLGAKSFPAKIVIDEGSIYDAVKQALSEGKPVPEKVLADYPDLATPKQQTQKPTVTTPAKKIVKPEQQKAVETVKETVETKKLVKPKQEPTSQPTKLVDFYDKNQSLRTGEFVREIAKGKNKGTVIVDYAGSNIKIKPDKIKNIYDKEIKKVAKELRKPDKGYGAENKLVSTERAEELKKKLRDKLNQLNIGIDAEFLSLGTELAVFHIEAGARKFSDFADRMVNDFGDKIRKYLKSFYMGAKFYPGLNNREMDNEEVIDEWLKEDTKKTSNEQLKPKLDGTKLLISLIEKKLSIGDNIKDNPALNKLAEESFGGSRAQGTFDSSDAYEALEAGINQYILNNLPRGLPVNPKVMLGTLRKILTKIPTQTHRTAEKDLLQQFSTPPTISYVAAIALNPQANDIILEPSAGTGNLAIMPVMMSDAKVITNEIDKNRENILKHLGFQTYSVDGEYINATLPQEIKPTAIIMNPPFSSTGGRVKSNDTKYGFRHIDSALQRLQTNGRLVAILGESAGLTREKSAEWWRNTFEKYNVRAIIGIPGKEYYKYGTTFGSIIAVIDKTGATPGSNLSEKLEQIVNIEVTELEEALDVIKEIAKDRPAIKQPGKPKPPTKLESDNRNLHRRERESKGETNRRSGLSKSTKPGQRGLLDISGEQPGEGAGTISESESESKRATTTKKELRKPEQKREIRDRSGIAKDSKRLENETDISFEANIEDSQLRESDDSGKFVKYVPAKLRGGEKHPADIVETASMSAVDPPHISYKANIPANIINDGKLSNLQLEAISYAGQQHQIILPNGRRAGFFLGDGTGVGKGRQLAGIILDNWNNGRKKSIWLSASSDLYEDAKRDLEGIDAGHIPTSLINDFKVHDSIDMKNGILFSTYNSLISESKGKKRLDQIVEWLGADGVIIFDEAHKAKNALADKGNQGVTKTGQAVVDIQEVYLPKAYVVYSSATGATDVRNMAYMTRLGLWGEETPFYNFGSFMTSIENGGLGAMEVVARDMKALGKYASRSISFNGVEYNETTHNLNTEQLKMYNYAAKGWQVVLEHFEDTLLLNNASGQAKAMAMKQFWNSHQRFFRQVTTAFKVPTLIRLTESEIEQGNSVVIGLIGTGEARTAQKVSQAIAEGKSLDELDFTPREVLASLIDKSFPTTMYTEVTDPLTGKTSSVVMKDSKGNPLENPEAVKAKEELLNKISDMKLPENPLDQIVNYFGADKVAELTGRKKRLIRDKTGKVKSVKRAPDGVAMKKVNIYEMSEFQNGKKNIAIISDAASTGISLHDDRNNKKQNRRIHITLELGWSADKQLQTFGRTHRSNQASAPKYILLSTNVGGEKRFSSTIARRLASLGALTRGQKDATGGGDLAKYNFETSEGIAALGYLYEQIIRGKEIEGLDAPIETLRRMGVLKKNKEGVEKIPDNAKGDIGKFLNRILALEVDEQNAMFDAFINTFDLTVETAKATGTFDDGVADIKGASEIRFINKAKVATDKKTGAKTEHVLLEADFPTKPISFIDAVNETKKDSKIKFYKQNKSGNYVIAKEIAGKTNASTGYVERRMRLYRYNGKHENMSYYNFEYKYERVNSDEAQEWWDERYNKYPNYKTEEIHLISGVILPVWDKIKNNIKNNKLKIVRVNDKNNNRYIGIKIPNTDVENVLQAIGIERKIVKPNQVYLAVLNGKQIQLANGLSLITSRIYGEQAIRVLGVRSDMYDMFRDMGLINERINWEQQFFIPNDEEVGIEIIKKILKKFPVSKIGFELQTTSILKKADQAWNDEAVKILEKAVEGVKVKYVSEEELMKDFKLGDYYAKLKESGKTLTKAPLGTYWETGNIILINKDRANKDTIFHEFAHPVINHIRNTDRALYDEGINLIQGSSYLERAERAKYPRSEEEALVMAIGEKGAKLQAGAQKNAFMAWLNRLFLKAKLIFKNTFNINLKLDDFVSSIALKMRSGKRLVRPQSNIGAFAQQETLAEPFFSQAERVINSKFPNKMKAQSVKNFLLKNQVKQEELDWLDLDSFLKKKMVVKKDDLTRFVRENNVKIEEKIKGNEKNIGDVIFGITENGDVFLKHPQISDRWLTRADEHIPDFEMKYYVDSEHNFKYDEELQENVVLWKNSDYPEPYNSDDLIRIGLGDWIDSIKGKTRYNIPDLTIPGGKNYKELLFTLPQERREETYSAQYIKGRWFVVNDVTGMEIATPFDSKHLSESNARKIAKEKTKALMDVGGRIVPNAPFKKTYHQFVLKRMLRYAAENGYDKVAWTTGAQQADRYDLRKQVKSITLRRKNSDFFAMTGETVDRNAQFPVRQSIGINELENYVGKDLAQKAHEIKVGQRKTFVGDDLKVGGAGMNKFYDELIPGYLNKFGKRFGAKVKDTVINIDGENVTVKSIPITQQMQETALYEGFPQFQKPDISSRDAKFIGMQQIPGKDSIPLFNITQKGHELEGSTVTLATLKREGLEIPDWERRQYQLETIEDVDRKPLSLPLDTKKKIIERVVFDRYSRATTTIKEAETQLGDMFDEKELDDLVQAKLLEKEGDEYRIGDPINFRQKIVLFPGRTSEIQKKLDRVLTNPKNGFLKRLDDAGYTIDDLGWYLLARHAEERNEYIVNNINEENESGSGMTTEEANKILEEFVDTDIADFAKEFDSVVIKPMLKMRYDSGMLDSESYLKLKTMFKNYVPLKSEQISGQQFRGGTGFSVGSKYLPRIKKGRSSLPDNPFLRAIMDYHIVTIATEKNKVGQSFYNFLKKIPTDFATVRGAKSFPLYDEKGNQTFFMHEKLDENEMAVWVAGKKKVIKIIDYKGKELLKDEKINLLLRAMKNLGAENVPVYLRALNGVNSWLRLVTTYYSPAFVITNFERDLQTALINLSEENIKGLRSNVVKDIPKALRGIWLDTRLKDKESEYKKWYDTFKNAGAKTGWWDHKSVEEISKELQKKIKFNKRKPGVIFKHTIDFVADINDAVENAVRLSTFVNLVKAGYSEEKAANVAKNLTINFNQKGEVGHAFNALYLFWNAGAQGPARIYKAIKHKTVKKVVLGIAVFSAVLDWVNRMIDEDEWDKIPDYIKDTNYIILLPNKKHIKIRLPYGYNIFNVMGSIMGTTIHKAADKEIDWRFTMQQGKRMLNAFGDAVNPWGVAGSLGQIISPTGLDFLVQIGQNKNFFGGPIRKEQSQYAPKKPEAKMYFESVNPAAQLLTDTLHKIGGGTEVEKSIFEDMPLGQYWMNPENIEHAFEFFGGGVGKTLNNILITGTTLAKEGKFPELNKIPFSRLFYGESQGWMTNKIVYDMLDEAGRTKYSDKEKDLFYNTLTKMFNDGAIKDSAYQRMNTTFTNAQNKIDRARAGKTLTKPKTTKPVKPSFGKSGFKNKTLKKGGFK